MKAILKAAGLLLVVVHIGLADDYSQWSNLKSLRKGDRIGVVQANYKRVEGNFDSATDARLTLEAGLQLVLEKDEVIRVYRPARHGRVFGGVVGGLVGAAVGAAADATLGHYFRNESDGPARGAITAAVGVSGAGIGAAIAGGYRTVYQRQK